MSSPKRTQVRWRVATFLFMTGLIGGFWAFLKFVPAVRAVVSDQVRGMIVLQVERNGEAWYVEPGALHRFYLGRPHDAFDIMRQQGLGISDADLNKIPAVGSTTPGDLELRRRLSGRILLQVERNGEAWYVYPKTRQRHFLGRPDDAWQLMRQLGLGISNYDLYQIASERNLDVPFTSQAPLGIWDFDHDNFCEEAAALMATRFVLGGPIGDPAEADAALYRLKNWEVENLGYHKDTDAADTADMITANFSVTAEVMERPTASFIRRSIDQGRPVIVPAAGRLLGNTHFRGFGPLYHMFVIRGYTNDGWFITNEPGTRFGRNYRYRQATVMNAIHDFNGGRVVSGKPVVIVVAAR